MIMASCIEHTYNNIVQRSVRSFVSVDFDFLSNSQLGLEHRIFKKVT